MPSLNAAPLAVPTLHPSGVAVATVTIAMAVLGLMCFGVAAWASIARRDPRLIAVVAGGALAVWNEPIVDVLTLLYFDPSIGTITTMGRQLPLWVLCFYPIYYGFAALALYEAASWGWSSARIRGAIAIFMVCQTLLEWLLLSLDLYAYYGDQPFAVLGLPLYWLFINSPGILAVAVVLRRRPDWFRGWRSVGLLVAVPTLVTASSLGTGWAVFSGLNRPEHSSVFFVWLGATLTVCVSVYLIGVLTSALCDGGVRAMTSQSRMLTGRKG